MRLIDANEFIKEINNRCESAIKWGINAIADHNEEIRIRAEQAVATFCEASLTAKKMPTIDAEPIVRCKDCKFNYANQIPSGDGCQLCVELPISKDFFCAYGERMDEEGKTNDPYL